MVADWSGALVSWEAELTEMKKRLSVAFPRSETRKSANAFIDGVLSDADRKTGWMLSEEAGLGRPYRIQSLLGRSRWEADALRDPVREEARDASGDADGVLVVDETGF